MSLLRNFWKRSEGRLLTRVLALALLPAVLGAQAATPASATVNPELERTALIKLLQKRLPGSGPADWTAGMAANVAGVNVMPLSPEYSTNFADVLAIGKKMWDRPFANGKSLAKCFANGGKGLATAYPQYDAKAQRLITLEMALNDCRVAQGEKEIAPANTGVMGPLLAYARNLSTGQKLNIRVTGAPALDQYEAGKALFQRRMGDMAYACASCHVLHAGSIYVEGAGGAEGEVRRVLPPAVGAAAAWPRVQPGGTVRTLQMQFQTCMLRTGASPFPLGSEAMNALEYYLVQLSHGLTISPLTATK